VNFDWSAQQRELYQRTRSAQFASGRAEVWAQFGALGVLGMRVPTRASERPLDFLACCALLEGLGESAVPVGLALAAMVQAIGVCDVLSELGSQDQKARLLPALAAGSTRGAIAITEAHASGSNPLAGLQTRAHALADGSLRLRGHKRFIANGVGADVLLVLANIEDAHGSLPGLLIVEPSRSLGVSIEPLDSYGLPDAALAEVRFDDFAIPAQSTLGPRGLAGPILHRIMTRERALLMAVLIGAMRRQLQAGLSAPGLSHARERAVRMKANLEAATLLTRRACWDLDRGDHTGSSAALAKQFVSEAFLENSLHSFRAGGANQYRSGAAAVRDLLDALGMLYACGSQEMMEQTVAAGLCDAWPVA
jgi:alkylation response protein AidB-like acyl-CoA dehydrogenase